MRIHLTLTLVIAVGCGAPVGNSTSNGIGKTQEAIEGGSPDSSHRAVGVFWRPDNKELCSGTLITPSIVMTAAHCFNGINTNNGNPIFYTGNGVGGINNGNYDPGTDPGLTPHNVQTWTIAQGFVDGCPNKNDLALVLLSDEQWGVSSGYAHAGFPIPGAGTPVTAVGVGDHSGSVGAKYNGVENIVAVDPTDIQVQYGTGSNAGFAGHGDSGGPIYYNNIIIGTTMCHNASDTIEYYQRVDQLATWIDSVVQQWEQPCYNNCASFYSSCGTNCFCLADYYTCMRMGCGHGEPVISCFPF
jgi:hypothetical protein